MQTILQHPVATTYTREKKSSSLLRRFFAWCKGQEKNRFGWVALILAVLIGLGGAYVGSLLEDRPAVPTPAEVDLAPVPSPSERAVPSEPAAKMMLEVPRVPSGDATGDPPASVPEIEKAL